MTGQSKLPSPVGNNAVLAKTATTTDVQLPMWIEGVIIGGIGLGCYVAPSVAKFMKEKMNVLRLHVRRVGDCIRAEIVERWEPINRKRKNGSLIRVIATVLPDCLFTPPCRMFIPTTAGFMASSILHGDAETGRMARAVTLGADTGLGMTTTTFRDGFGELDGVPNEDGLIVAFQIDSDSTQDGTDATRDIEDSCSNPEGWDPIFLPAASSTRFACSTPELRHGSHNFLNDSFSTQNSEAPGHDVKEELADLRNMVKELLLQMGTLNQTRPMSGSYVVNDNSIVTNQVTTIGQKTANSSTFVPVVLPPPPPQVFPVPVSRTNGPCGPAPPPPPPPPMPAVPFSGFQPLITPRKMGDSSKTKQVEKTGGGTVSINLKDIKGVQLRPTPKSPGGTPLKSSGSNHSSTLDLTDVLKRRYQAWHSPTPSEKDYGEKENFDENAFDDSFFVEEVKTAFKPDLKYLGRNKMSARSSTEKSVPFGQHLLKKGTQNSPLETQPRPKVLGEQNY